MQLSSTLSWLVDAASETPSADRLLAEIGTRLLADGLPLAGGALTMAVPHPLIARRTWLWRADSGEVIEALGFAGGFAGGLAAALSATGGASSASDDAGRNWLTKLAAGTVHEDSVGLSQDAPLLGWIGPRPFTQPEADALRQAARFAAALLAVLAAEASAQSRAFYDSSGRRIGSASTDSQGTVTNHDARGKVISRESTSGTGTNTVYDASGRNVGRFGTNR